MGRKPAMTEISVLSDPFQAPGFEIPPGISSFIDSIHFLRFRNPFSAIPFLSMGGGYLSFIIL